MAGITVDASVSSTFDQMKLSKQFGAIIFRLSDDRKKVIVDQTVGVRAVDEDSVDTLRDKFKAFVALLPGSEPRYAVYDFCFRVEGAPRSKLVFINWCPEGAKPALKVPHSATKDSVKKALNLGVEFQATDPSEIDFQYIYDKLASM